MPKIALPSGLALDYLDEGEGAPLLRLAGMGHDLPRALWPVVAGAVAQLAGLQAAPATAPGSPLESVRIPV